MAPYADIVDNVIVNVLEADADMAATIGLVALPEGAWIGWTTTDGVAWTAPPPDPAQVALETAQGTIASLFSNTSAMTQQIQSDAALFSGTQPNADGSYTFTAEHFAAWTRAVNGFATVMQAIEAHLALTGNLP